MLRLLPKIQSIRYYKSVYGTPAAWDSAVRSICQRHGLPFNEFTKINVGTHIVYARTGRSVIKLYCPLFPEDHQAERLVLQHISNRISIRTPEIICEGELEGWLYLILSFVEGEPIGQLWPTLDDPTRVKLAESIGVLMAEWHALPVAGLEALDVNWPAFINKQINNAAKRQIDNGWSEYWTDQVSDYLGDFDGLLSGPAQPVLLNADFTNEHILLRERDGLWAVSGLIDFGDAMLGHSEYEFVAPGIDIMQGAGESQRAMLQAYGFDAHEVNDDLRRRLMQWTLVHQYVDMPALLESIGAENQPRTIDDLARHLWAF